MLTVAAGCGCNPIFGISPGIAQGPETCPGESVSVAPGQTVSIQGDTTGATDEFTGTANLGNCNGKLVRSPDLVYAVTPGASGTLNAGMDPMNTSTYVYPLIRIRTECPGTAVDEIACEAGTKRSVATTATVTGGTTYYVVADGWDPEGQTVSGPFTLTLSLQ
jgi:hypothetical protein